MSPAQVVLVAHADPPIHGQAVAAAALIEESKGWSTIKLHHVNAVYAESRGDLTRFSVRKLFKLVSYLIRSVRLVRSKGASVVIVTPAFFRGPFLKDALMIGALRAFTRAKVVGWVHMDPARIEFESAPKWLKKIITMIMRSVDSWLACSPALVEMWPGFLPKRLCTGLANGIEAPSCPQRGAPLPVLRVSYLSAMDSEKGWVEAVAAARSICSGNPHVEFHFHGNALSLEDESKVKQEFELGPHADRIRWHGPAWGDRKWAALASADLFCFPSHTEQFPIAVLDAMASGLPVVATRVGAVADAIEQGRGGWLVSPGNAAELEQALVLAISDPHRLRAFGEHNRRRFEEQFTRAAFGKRWEKFLQSKTAQS